MMKNQEIKGSFKIVSLFHKWMGIFRRLVDYF